MSMYAARRLSRGTWAWVALGAALAGTLAGGGRATASIPGPPAAATISTVAGGVGGPALGTTVPLTGACGMAFHDGSLYVSEEAPYYVDVDDRSEVRAVSMSTGQLTTPAGTGAFAPAGDHGPAARAALLDVCGVGFGPSGTMALAEHDVDYARVRVVAGTTGTFYGQAMTAGHIYTIAGTLTSGYNGNGMLGTRTELGDPWGTAVDSAGNVLVTDPGDGRVWVVAVSTGSYYGIAMTAGHIYTIAMMLDPFQLTLDAAGNLVIATGGNTVDVLAESTGTFYGQAMTAGHTYTIAGTGTAGYAGDGGPATSAELDDPSGIALDSAGNVLVADSANQRVRVVAEHTGSYYGQAMTAGHIYLIGGDGTAGFSGDGGPATSAEFDGPAGVAVDSAGNVLVADFYDARARVICGSTGRYYGQNMTAGDVYTVAGTGTEWGFSGDGRLATRAQIDLTGNYFGGVGTDAAGDVLIADNVNNRIRMVPASTGTYFGRKMTAQHIYTVAGNGMTGFSGDGGSATEAELDNPIDVTADHAGNLVIADVGNYRIRVVAARTGTYYGQKMITGHIYTVAGDGAMSGSSGGRVATKAPLFGPQGVAVDSAGNVLIADADRIQVVAVSTGTFYGRAMKGGHIYGVAGDAHTGSGGNGGPALHASLDGAAGVSVDGAGNVIIADALNNEVRVVADRTGTFYGQAMTAGDIYLLAGAVAGGEFSEPASVAVDSAGNIIVADELHDQIRVISASTGTFYGQAMTAGGVYTIAGLTDMYGDGIQGYSGDGGPAARAELCLPGSVAIDPAGQVLIADSCNNRIREITG